MYVEAKSIGQIVDVPVDPTTTGPAILLVDDDPCILDALRRQLRKKFPIHIAIGGLQGLETIEKSGPFGVVMSDLQMPGMDGIEFLSKVRATSPETVRVMLTGRADISAAMAAVNQGNIFRFLLKPCTTVVIEKVLQAALEQYRLVISERQVIRETLLGCVQVLVEVLSVVQPDAFSRASRVRRHVREIAAVMGLKDTWELEAAAMLSQIGWITLHPAILAKAAANQPLLEAEQTSFLAHASVAARMLEKIPRLGKVASMIGNQHVRTDNPCCLMSEILRAAIEFDTQHRRGVIHKDVVNRMRANADMYLPEVLTAMSTVAENAEASEVKFVTIATLEPGQVLEEGLRGSNGCLLLGKGEELTAPLIARLTSLGLAPRQRVRVRSIGYTPF